MCIRYSYAVACKIASQMGASIERGSGDWNRAVGFPSAEVAWCFQTEFNGMESVGAFREENGYTVQFR